MYVKFFRNKKVNACEKGLTLKHQSHKMVKHTQTIRRQITDELFEYACLTILWNWHLKG